MCVSAVLLAATAVSAAATYQQGREAKAQANYAADQAEADAQAERGAAAVYAEKIRKAGQQARSAQEAALAGSGASLGSDSATALDEATASAYEQDALVAMYGGEGRARRKLAEGQGYRIAGSRAERSALVSAATSAATGWYKANGRSMASAAPIENRTQPPARARYDGNAWGQY